MTTAADYDSSDHNVELSPILAAHRGSGLLLRPLWWLSLWLEKSLSRGLFEASRPTPPQKMFVGGVVELQIRKSCRFFHRK